ncbi:MAG: carbamoyl phosphate synthase-like protein [Syntrophus sp. PtaB.Bin138]|nr:MAG: carbamoyl phosphate synthase-like protein [Syntrophus sp. PtaB.Bin138]
MKNTGPDREFHVILCSVGRRSYLVRYFREALSGRGKVLATNCVPDAPGMIAADQAFLVPPAYEKGFVERLLDICQQHRPRLLFSLHDLEISVLSRHTEAFKRLGTFPVLASHGFCDTCMDKFATVGFAEEHGLHAGKTYLSVEDARAAIREKIISYPVVLKPRYGFGSIGLCEAHDEREMEMRFDLLRLEIARTTIAMANAKNEKKAILIQEKLRGTEYGLDVINDLRGDFVTCLIERKQGMRSGETDAAEIVEDEKLFALGKKLGEIAQHPGVLDVDVIVQDNIPHVLEMNPRFGGHYPFAHMAGADIPSALIAWAEGRQPEPSWLRAVPGIRCFKDISLIIT